MLNEENRRWFVSTGISILFIAASTAETKYEHFVCNTPDHWAKSTFLCSHPYVLVAIHLLCLIIAKAILESLVTTFSKRKEPSSQQPSVDEEGLPP